MLRRLDLLPVEPADPPDDVEDQAGESEVLANQHRRVFYSNPFLDDVQLARSYSDPNASPSIVEPATVVQPAGVPQQISSSPVFPSVGPFSASYIPASWDGSSVQLLFAPNNTARIQRVMKTVANSVGVASSNSGGGGSNPRYIQVVGFKSAAQLVDYYMENGMRTWAGIVFHQPNSSSWNYSIRINGTWSAPSAAAEQAVVSGHLSGAGTDDWQRYHQTGFLRLQYAVDTAIVHEIAPQPMPQVPNQYPASPDARRCFASASAQELDPWSTCNTSAISGFCSLPALKDSTQNHIWIFRWLVGWCVNVASAFWMSSHIVTLVQERERFDSMRLMGLLSSAYQIAALACGLIFALPMAVAFTVVLRLVNVVFVSSLLLVTVYLFSYLVNMVAFAYAVTPFMKRGARVSLLCFLGAFICGALYASLLIFPANSSSLAAGTYTPADWKLMMSIVPFLGGHAFGEVLGRLEDANLGINPETAASSSSQVPSYNSLLAMSAFSLLFWSVLPHACGSLATSITQLRQCCCPARPSTPVLEQDQAPQPMQQAHGPHGQGNGGDGGIGGHEALESGARGRVVVRVRALTKIYPPSGCKLGGAGTAAVKHIDLDLVEGQIFSLLGHNGAGKTSTIKACTEGGASSGTISYKIGGKFFRVGDPVDDAVIRASLGVCPQHNILWDDCTAREHLQLFAALRRVDSDTRDGQVDSMLERICLPPGEEDVPVGILSGGNKRKVSLAIALIGDPQFVFLDEPTCGMDPLSRRQIWDMLQQFKVGRTIVLCTHFLDEADLLGDRIGIMNDGRMVCSGSSLFLKRQFGTGYRLSLTGTSIDGVDAADNVAAIDSAVQAALPEATRLRTRSGMDYRIPITCSHKFTPALRSVEKIKSANALDLHMSLSLTTLEDVFFKVGPDAPSASGALRPHGCSMDRSVSSELITGLRGESRSYSSARVIRSICCARWRTMSRRPDQLSVTLVLPGIFVLLGFFVGISLHQQPLVTSSALKLSAHLLHNATSQAGSAGGCALDFVVDDASVIAASTLDAAAHGAGFTKTRAWNSSAQMSETLSADLSQRLDVNSSPDAQTPSCGAVSLGAQFQVEKTLFVGGLSSIMWANASLVGSLPVLQNLRSNALAQQLGADASISVINHPLPYNSASVVDPARLFVPIFVGMAYVSVGLGAIALVSDRESRRLHLLHLIGVPYREYVFGNLAFEVCCVAGPLLLLTAVLIVALQAFWFYGSCYAGLLMLGATSAPATAIFAYAASTMFSTQVQASRLWPLVLPIITVIPFVLILVMQQPGSSKTSSDAGDVLRHVFVLLPSFAFQDGVQQLMTLQPTASDSVKFGTVMSLESGIGEHLLVTVIWVLGGICVIMCHSAFNSRGQQGRAAETTADVQAGAEEGGRAHISADRMVKKYGDAVAVDGVSFRVPVGEVFVLLGPNGAGKTTTMRVLSTETPPSGGTVSLAGLDSVMHRDLLRKTSTLGLCLQFDALYDCLSVWEHLLMFAHVQGAAEPCKVAAIVLAAVGMQHYRHTWASQLSGGNKRRLSVALAIIGAPTITILDEPSSGVDVVTQRILWNVIRDLRHMSSVVVSTHSMEEAVSLHDRIGIMMKGRLVCADTASNLQRRYGRKMILQISTSAGCAEQVCDAVLEKFSARLAERFCDELRLEVIGTPASDLFEFMERLVAPTPSSIGESKSTPRTLSLQVDVQYPVKFYAISNATMQDVFISLCTEGRTLSSRRSSSFTSGLPTT